MLVPVFHADVTPDGARLVFDDREAPMRRRLLTAYAGQRVEVVVRKHRSRRSTQQLRWIRGVAVPLLGMELGYDKNELDDLHYALLVECYGTHTDKASGRDVPNVKHSGDLNTKEISDYMEWLVRFAATQYGVVIPLPGEAELAR